MNSDELYSFLYSWVNLILNDEGKLEVPIIQSHQNAPSPSENDRYITIGFGPNRTKVGQSYADAVDEEGSRNLINDYNLTIEIWEVNGNGDLLSKLINSIGRQYIKDLWAQNNFSLSIEGDIMNMSRIEADNWVREFMIELTIITADVTLEPDAGRIEDVIYNGTIPAQGRSGDHTITNKNE